MKRQHIIERLVAANYCGPALLHGLTNDRLNNLYQRVWPRLIMKSDRQRRRQQRLAAERQAERNFKAWQKEWLANWVHPKVKYPLTGPGVVVEARPRLDFGLKDLRETASWMAHHHGDSNALSTLRVLAGRPKEDQYDVRRSGRRRKHGRRFRRPHGNSVQQEHREGHARVG